MSLVHLIGAILILFSIHSLASIISGNYIIKDFKLEGKNTYLTRLINLRLKFYCFIVLWTLS